MNKKIGLCLATALVLASAAASRALAEDKATAQAELQVKEKAEEKAKPEAVAKKDAPGSLAPGNKLLAQGKFEEAWAYFDGIGEQLALNGHAKREPWRWVGLSTAELGLAKFSDAAQSAQKALDIDAKNAAAWNNLGLALSQDGKRQEAVDAYAKGIEALKGAGLDASKLEINKAMLQAALDASKLQAEKKAQKEGQSKVDLANDNVASGPSGLNKKQ